jgi:hypothetical protein
VHDRLALGLLFGSARLTTGGSSAPVAAQSCDPAYVCHCVPPLPKVGDLNCDWFYAQGIYGIVLADPHNDPHGLDGWNYVDDGYGLRGLRNSHERRLDRANDVVHSWRPYARPRWVHPGIDAPPREQKLARAQSGPKCTAR